MVKFRFGLVGLTMTSALALVSANAADMYSPGPASPGGFKDGPYAPVWTGFYLGVNGGYAWGYGNGIEDFDVTAGGTPLTGVVHPALKPSGGFGGGQIGYNYQGALGYRSVVVGMEADFQGAHIEDSYIQNFPSLPGAPTDTYKTTIDYFGTVRGQARLCFWTGLDIFYRGFRLWQRQLCTHGQEQHALHRTLSASPEYRPATFSAAELEYAVMPSWSIKAEYQYIDLGSEVATGSGCCFGQAHVAHVLNTNPLNTSFNTVRLGLNYHINNEYVPLK